MGWGSIVSLQFLHPALLSVSILNTPSFIIRKKLSSALSELILPCTCAKLYIVLRSCSNTAEDGFKDTIFAHLAVPARSTSADL